MIKLLITDDEKFIRQGIEKILKDALGSRLCTFSAKNGKEALDLVLKEKPHIIITDIRMPILDGIELMRTLQSMENAPEIVVLSGYDDFSYAKQAIESGAVSYLLKPVDKEELIKTVSKIMQKLEKQTQTDVCYMLRDIVENGVGKNNVPLKKSFREFGFFCLVTHTDTFDAFIQEMVITEYYPFEQKQSITIALVSFSDGEKIKEQMKDMVDYKVALSLPSKSVSNLRFIYDQALIAFMEFYLHTDKKGCIAYTEKKVVNNFFAVDSTFEKLVYAIQNGDVDLICNMVSELCDVSDKEEEKQGAVLFYVYQLVVQKLSNRFLSYAETDSYLASKQIMIEKIWECGSIDVWQRYLVVMPYMFLL